MRLQGSRDNMSMVLVTFPACPPPVDEATKKEAQLEELLKNRVTELVKESDGNVELPHILQTLGEWSTNILNGIFVPLSPLHLGFARLYIFDK